MEKKEIKNSKYPNSTFAIRRCSSCGKTSVNVNLWLLSGTNNTYLCDECYNMNKGSLSMML